MPIEHESAVIDIDSDQSSSTVPSSMEFDQPSLLAESEFFNNAPKENFSLVLGEVDASPDTYKTAQFNVTDRGTAYVVPSRDKPSSNEPKPVSNHTAAIITQAILRMQQQDGNIDPAPTLHVDNMAGILEMDDDHEVLKIGGEIVLQVTDDGLQKLENYSLNPEVSIQTSYVPESAIQTYILRYVIPFMVEDVILDLLTSKRIEPGGYYKDAFDAITARILMLLTVEMQMNIVQEDVFVKYLMNKNSKTDYLPKDFPWSKIAKKCLDVFGAVDAILVAGKFDKYLNTFGIEMINSKPTLTQAEAMFLKLLRQPKIPMELREKFQANKNISRRILEFLASGARESLESFIELEYPPGDDIYQNELPNHKETVDDSLKNAQAYDIPEQPVMLTGPRFPHAHKRF